MHETRPRPLVLLAWGEPERLARVAAALSDDGIGVIGLVADVSTLAAVARAARPDAMVVGDLADGTAWDGLIAVREAPALVSIPVIVCLGADVADPPVIQIALDRQGLGAQVYLSDPSTERVVAALHDTLAGLPPPQRPS